LPVELANSTKSVSKRAVATSAAARSPFETLLSGRVVHFCALPILKNCLYYLTLTINGFVASIFFAFFKVFLAILFPPRLICPVGLRPT
jgi:hypothetical protein